jgi:hypothetical protein
MSQPSTFKISPDESMASDAMTPSMTIPLPGFLMYCSICSAVVFFSSAKSVPRRD